jgi:protein-S-isoprenylcysteine O-methyltransferase Ste14
MEEEYKNKESSGEDKKKYTIHHILAHSYSFYFLFFLIGVLLDLLFPVKILDSYLMTFTGILLLVFASVLILWAQRTSRDLGKINEIKKESFCRGPYCYTRSPTHWGLFLLMLGFGITANAFFIVITSIISLIFTKFSFLKEEEDILALKYGAPYIEYKKKVRL